MATLVNTVATSKQKIKELIDLSYFLKNVFLFDWASVNNGLRGWNFMPFSFIKNDSLTTR